MPAEAPPSWAPVPEVAPTPTVAPQDELPEAATTAAAMQAWAACVAEAAEAHGEGAFDPVEACGERPVPDEDSEAADVEQAPPAAADFGLETAESAQEDGRGFGEDTAGSAQADGQDSGEETAGSAQEDGQGFGEDTAEGSRPEGAGRP